MLFVGFRASKGAEGIYFAISADGYHWKMAQQHYGALFTADLKTWTEALPRIDFSAGMRHGSFLEITRAEYERLQALQ